MSNPLYVGIDISSKQNVVCCLTNDSEKQALSRFSVCNNRPGIMELQNRIHQLEQKHNFSKILFGLEHTGCYSTHAAVYLHQHLNFGCQDTKVYMFNPSLIKQFKKANFLDAPKNDRADAWYIASKLKAGHLPHPFSLNEPLMALQRLTRARYHIMKALVRESNFLMTNLYLKCSDYTLVFDNTLSATSLAIMEGFDSIEALAEIPLDELTEFLIEHGKNRFEDPTAVAKNLKKAVRSSYRLPKSMNDSVNLAMASSIRVIRTLQEQLKSLKKAISDHLAAIPQTLDSVPGIDRKSVV